MGEVPFRGRAARERVVELCKQFYDQGWASGTGGGICLRQGRSAYVAPSGVQKERLHPDDLFEVDLDGRVITAPADPALRVSECMPLFANAFRLRDAGAVLHSHSIHAMLVTLLEEPTFRVTHLEMMKGVAGVGYRDVLEIPIIENTDRECDLADDMARAMERYPETPAVLVRRHGVYVWGRDWVQAKTQAECLDYLFQAAVEMRKLGMDASRAPGRGGRRDASDLARARRAG